MLGSFPFDVVLRPCAPTTHPTFPLVTLPCWLLSPCCWVVQIPFNLTWQQLKDDFGGVAKVVRADIEMHPDGRSKGFALVTFETAEGAAKAIGV